MKPHVVICLLLLSCRLLAQESIQFDRLESVKNLTNRSITSIVQDDLGFLWFGTQDGLLRYDGYEIKVYKADLKNKNSLTDNNIQALAKDKNGNLWIATQGGGVDRFNVQRETFEHFKNNPTDSHSLSGNAAWSIFVDSKGLIWIGTFSNGLNVLDPASGKVKRVDEHNAQPVLAIAEDAEGKIWFGSSGLNVVDPRDFSLQNFRGSDASLSITSGGIRAILPANGKVWIGATDAGLFQFDLSSKTFVKHPISASGFTSVLTLQRDVKGKIWAGSNEGIAVINEGDITFCKHNPTDKYTLSINTIRAMYSDRNGTMWIGTAGAGVNRELKKKDFQVYRAGVNGESLSFNVIRSIFEDKSGKVWIGTQGGGLNLFEPVSKRFSKLTIGARDVSCIDEDIDGTFWIGSWGSGLFHYDPRTGKSQNYRHDPAGNSLLDDRIQVVHRDKQGVLWVGTESGLSKFDVAKNQWTPFVRPHFMNELTGNNIQGQAFLEDEDGTLWIGTWFGLNKVSPDRNVIQYFKYDTTGTGLSSDHVISLHHDKKNNVMWIGTFGGGLNKLDLVKGEVTHFTEEHGLPNNTIFGIRQDNDGSLWLGTNNGLSRFNPERNTFRNYDATEGLQGNEFYWGAVCRSRDGLMYFGGLNGLTVFNPADIKDDKTIPPVVVTSFEIFNKPVPVKAGTFLESNVNFAQEIFLNYDQNVLSFQYAALNYNSPEKNKYAYFLENFDKEWNYVGDKRSISYTNLNPGKYILRIRGSNNDGVWNDTGLALSIVVVPPFWQTWWFYTISSIVVIASIYTLIKLRLRSVRRDKEHIQKTLQSALDKAHDQLEREKQAVLDEQTKNMERNWIDQSLSIVSAILSRSKNNVAELCSKILSSLVKRCEVVAGAIYLYDETTDMLNGQANYGFNTMRASIPPGAGLIGECYTKREVMTVDNLPDNYYSVTSGLGESKPKSLLIVPLQYDEVCVGVIELASFSAIPIYRRQFIETLSAQLAATIHTTLMSQRTTRLLDESRTQTEELRVREEELKQNLEEMQSIQENYTRKTAEYEELINQLRGDRNLPTEMRAYL